MASRIARTPHLLECFRPKQTQIHFARLRDAMDFPAANRWLSDAANPGDRDRSAERVNDLFRFLCLIHDR